MNGLFITTALELEAQLADEAEACTGHVGKLHCDAPTPEWIEHLHLARQHAQRWRLLHDLFGLLLEGRPHLPPIVQRAALAAAITELDTIGNEPGGPC